MKKKDLAVHDITSVSQITSMVKVRELIKVRAAVIKVYDECKAFFEFCIRKKKILVHENVLSFAIRNDVFF